MCDVPGASANPKRSRADRSPSTSQTLRCGWAKAIDDVHAALRDFGSGIEHFTAWMGRRLESSAAMRCTPWRSQGSEPTLFPLGGWCERTAGLWGLAAHGPKCAGAGFPIHRFALDSLTREHSPL
jgi:hypothetical protein